MQMLEFLPTDLHVCVCVQLEWKKRTEKVFCEYKTNNSNILALGFWIARDFRLFLGFVILCECATFSLCVQQIRFFIVIWGSEMTM